MTQASKELHIAQPALSKTIRSLEDNLNVKLFDRKGKHIVLNKNGHVLLKYTNRVINLIEDAKKEIKDINYLQNNTVTIAMHAASKFLPNILLELKKQYPWIKLIINQHENKDAESDLIIYSTKDKVEDSNIYTLLEEEILLAVPVDHPFSSKNSVKLEGLATESFISLKSGKGLSEITKYYCQLAGFQPHTILDSDDPATIRGLISVGIGVAFLPEITWKMKVDNERIKLLSISDIDCRRYINIGWRRNSYQTKAAKLVCEFMISFFSNLKS